MRKYILYWFVGFIVCLAYRWCYSSCRGHWGMFFLSWLADCFPPKAVFSNNFCGGFSGQGFCFSLWELGSYCLVHRPVTRCNINNTAGKIRSVLFMSCEESQLGLCFIWKAAFKQQLIPLHLLSYQIYIFLSKYLDKMISTIPYSVQPTITLICEPQIALI